MVLLSLYYKVEQLGVIAYKTLALWQQVPKLINVLLLMFFAAAQQRLVTIKAEPKQINSY
jgi:hypothetical protein